MMSVAQYQAMGLLPLQMSGRLADNGRSFPALDDALQLAEFKPSADSHMQQDGDSLLRSQWSIQAVPDLASKKQDFELLRRWLSVGLCRPSDHDCRTQHTDLPLPEPLMISREFLQSCSVPSVTP